MKTAKSITALFSSMFIAIHVQAQGTLTPPGAPDATMKTLEQVEPRTPISSAPYTISQSGSYYLTTNLTSTGHGVVIAASGVTLDLMGFTISGDGGFSDYGVILDGTTSSAIRNVVVHNGIVRNFGIGVRANYTQDSRFGRLITATNSFYGVYLTDGISGQCDGNTIADCTISGNGDSGIALNGDDNTIADCTISGNGSYGIFLAGAGGQCDGNTITDCTISGNGDSGVYLTGIDFGQCNGNTIADCTISGNGDSGVYLKSSSVGQCDGNTIADCTISGNGIDGIWMYYAEGNRVEGNHVTGNTTVGIHCTATAGNLIFRNTCVGQGANNFNFNPADTYGPEVSASGALPTTGAGAHPLANFSR